MNLVLHAHPDDELLFAGALMLRGGDWTTVSLTAGRPYPGISLGFPGDSHLLHRREYLAWRDAVRDLRLEPELVITHNAMGEYGHPHHMAVHAIAHELFPAVWDFYVDVPSSVGSQRREAGLFGITVTPAKRAQFDSVYPGIYEELRADKPELIDRLFEVERFTGASLHAGAVLSLPPRS